MEMKDWSLEELRKRIDTLDARILKILDERMEIALRIRRTKERVHDPKREAEVLEGVRRQSQGLTRPEFSEALFSQIIAESRALQEKDLKLCGFQGEHGAYGEVAVRRYGTNLVPMPCTEFPDVFEGVRNGQLDCGLVPVENSLAGAVSLVNDLLVESDLFVTGEVYVPVQHCLMAPRETDYRDIRVVYSHPMALAQCHGFISRNKLESRSFYDTAGAARMLADERPTASAAIASRLAAQLYDLEVLKENIEDHPSNHTRFLVISRQPNKEPGDKCSIVFSTAHKAGALYEVLKIFSEAGVNLTRIESRPARLDFGRYAFLLDLAGSPEDSKVASVLTQVEKTVERYRLLGAYKEAKR